MPATPKTEKSSKATTSNKKTVGTKAAPKATGTKAAVTKPVVKPGVNKTAKPTKPQPSESRVRYFKIVDNEGLKGRGRFSGRKPKQAANKALTSILKERVKANESTNDEINFSIVECTRGSKNKVYCYIGQKKLLEEPMTVKIGDKEITYKHSNVVSKDKNAKPVVQNGGSKKKADGKAKGKGKVRKGKINPKVKAESKADDEVEAKVEPEPEPEPEPKAVPKPKAKAKANTEPKAKPAQKGKTPAKKQASKTA